MAKIRLEAVGYRFDEGEALFRDVSVVLGRGFTGVVGPNGAGKTTLLRLLAGELAPREGSRSGPPPEQVVLCPQRVDAPTPEVLALVDAMGREAQRWRSRLGLAAEHLARWETLSPGERRRWQLGAALAAEPEALLLDEPTNHVDAETRQSIVAALARFRGVGVLVSHERALLDTLATQIVWLEHGRARVYVGNYAAARAQREQELGALRSVRDELRGQQRQLARRLHEERRASEAATREISARTRMKGVRDHDGRSALAKGRVEHAARKLSRRVSGTARQHQRVEAALAEAFVREPLGRSLFVDYEPAPKRRLLALTRDVITRGEREVLRDVSLVVERDSHLWLRGPNGAGKTTLLRALRDACGLPPERVLFLAQDQPAEEGARTLRAALALPSDARGRVFEVLAALGAAPEQVLRTSQPSPGEAKKLALALGLARHVWLVMLDEPTNHLDLPSVLRLEQALVGYPGALVLATHDTDFAQATCSATLSIERGALR